MRTIWLLAAGLTLVTTLTTVQLARVIHDFGDFRGHRDPPIEPWMTIGSVARAYDVRSATMQAALGLPSNRQDSRTLQRIAADRGVSFAAVRASLQVAIAAARTPRPDIAR